MEAPWGARAAGVEGGRRGSGGAAHVEEPAKRASGPRAWSEGGPGARSRRCWRAARAGRTPQPAPRPRPWAALGGSGGAHLCCSSAWRDTSVCTTRTMSRTRTGQRHSSAKKGVGRCGQQAGVRWQGRAVRWKRVGGTEGGGGLRWRAGRRMRSVHTGSWFGFGATAACTRAPTGPPAPSTKPTRRFSCLATAAVAPHLGRKLQIDGLQQRSACLSSARSTPSTAPAAQAAAAAAAAAALRKRASEHASAAHVPWPPAASRRLWQQPAPLPRAQRKPAPRLGRSSSGRTLAASCASMN